MFLPLVFRCGGDLNSPNLFDCFDSMIDANVRSAIAAAAIFASFAKPSSLLLFTGAYAASQRTGTPSMLAYGMSKAAVHHLTLSLADNNSELTKKGATVACLLPITIDTPNNRHIMPKADFTEWTPTTTIAKHAMQWTREAMRRGDVTPNQAVAQRVKSFDAATRDEFSLPRLHHGGFYSFTTSNGITTVQQIDEQITLSSSIVAQ